MTTLQGQKELANQLRKEGKYIDAIKIYEELWKTSNDKFDGAGLLNCYRKLKMFNEAIPLARELAKKHIDFNWCKIEIIWTLIFGKLNQFPEATDISEIIKLANYILSLEPDELAEKFVIFGVLKFANQTQKYDTLLEWVKKIDPSKLHDDETQFGDIRKGWSNKEKWYNYYLKANLHTENCQEVIKVSDEAIINCPKQSKHFCRLKALAYRKLGDIENSKKIFKDLIDIPKPDWWLINEYADILHSEGEIEASLDLLYKACGHSKNYIMMVAMFFKISTTCKELNRIKESLDHAYLCKFIREREGWSIKDELSELLNQKLEGYENPNNLELALSNCKKVWILPHSNFKSNRGIRKNLSGTIKVLNENKPFGFIEYNNGKSIIYFKSELKDTFTNNQDVIFDALPTIDRKKQRDSWKAINVKHK